MEGADLKKQFRPTRLIIGVLILMLAISYFIEWYSSDVSMPRYCKKPELHVGYLRRLLLEETPAVDESRRPYLMAAKLLFIVPRQGGESIDAYLLRVREAIASHCR